MKKKMIYKNSKKIILILMIFSFKNYLKSMEFVKNHGKKAYDYSKYRIGQGWDILANNFKNIPKKYQYGLSAAGLGLAGYGAYRISNIEGIKKVPEYLRKKVKRGYKKIFNKIEYFLDRLEENINDEYYKNASKDIQELKILIEKVNDKQNQQKYLNRLNKIVEDSEKTIQPDK